MRQHINVMLEPIRLKMKREKERGRERQKE